MLDIAVSYNRYKFLGHEFLTWLWFLIEKKRRLIQETAETPVSLEIGNRIVLENRINDALESITIKGDEAGLEEGLLALRKGAVVIEMNLSFTFQENKWRFTLKGESLAFSSFRTPDTGPVETGDDIEGALLEKAYLYEQAVKLTDKLFSQFVRLRVSEEWNRTTVPEIKKWMASS